MKENSKTTLVFVVCGISLLLALITIISLWYLRLTAAGLTKKHIQPIFWKRRWYAWKLERAEYSPEFL